LKEDEKKEEIDDGPEEEINCLTSEAERLIFIKTFA
jgi:hypothetical protein